MRPLNTIILLIVVAIVCIGGTSFYFSSHSNHSAATNGSNPKAAESLIKKITQNKAVIMNQFSVLNNQLLGFVVKGSGTNAPEGVLFTNPAGTYVISGNILDVSGKNISQESYNQYVAPAKAAAAYKQIGSVDYVTDGKNSAAHKIYAIADPNCIFCHRFYQETRSYVKDGQLQIRWILGGLLKPSSKGKAASILGAKDPMAAFAENEAKFDESNEEGGIKAMSDIPADVAAKIKANSNFMINNQFLQTPTMLYKNSSGTAQLFTGLPKGKQLKALINSASASF